MPPQKTVDIFTDGACRRNPGPGGYGAVLICGERRRELSGGFLRTTNNRMEIFACIAALEKLKFPCRVTVTSDSKYVVNAIEKGWARRWRSRNWMRNKVDRAENADLWKRLLALCEEHAVTFKWVRGHAGHRENERCDYLATTAAGKSSLPPDAGYGTQLADT